MMHLATGFNPSLQNLPKRKISRQLNFDFGELYESGVQSSITSFAIKYDGKFSPQMMTQSSTSKEG